ncbi:cysteine--tRNA ligase [Candidatus Nomurabacteria bacterium RIFCSPHIGHO2_02_FULL_37_13]|uniref:Cysteine--tRNA ligase n=1 Tax=Candidatus Nomurabacteria bacterium RIFCSPHIGHO2_02_FULL_37_13 TaxID=1801750 RepID=A0A1F6W5G4_9BACT|nr:MAG: cysteine--tRNA ligase [Candidatus Nomurabacteria bacterium RIFCSPHIGHO2_01_FULL_36_23]OGI77149.1 MAG: cysteine--tRNA ligase [Candidatus Nomurabacteria bacterium RIFCSPHIGHO2_02_FULL_37_13]OGI88228.1 MAG: cysteine--tRNA ligase [Candidatus Nomurabacteria bacterium RIFCSPLOWO2_01_FULL_37_25]
MTSKKLQFYNTLARKKETFSPIRKDKVRMYTCGPTVYDYAHIGNLRAYVFADILQKTLEYGGYKVKRVMNITDIGHLSSDADSGEDKMTKGLLREKKKLTLKNMRELAEFYTKKFKKDLEKLNVKIPKEIYFASDYVKEDTELVQKLEKKEYTYKTSDGIYFNTSKMPDYGILWGGKREWKKEGARIVENSEKKNPEDFALWKFNSQIGFESPWGKGFPGWHIECSAMGIKFLGEQFDIHTGGIDHIPIHHTNEIAQSECATGKKPFVRVWMHNNFLDINNGEKMAKSGDSFITLRTITEKGISPIVYRFWLLMGHYRTKMNFNWEALEGAETALKRLYGLYMSLGEKIGKVDKEYQEKFKEFVFDDLDTPRALSLLWDVLKDEKISNANKKATILDFDKVLGLDFANLKEEKISEAILKLVEEREEVRKNKDFKKSDELRKKINSLGYEIEDKNSGYKINKI